MTLCMQHRAGERAEDVAGLFLINSRGARGTIQALAFGYKCGELAQPLMTAEEELVRRKVFKLAQTSHQRGTQAQRSLGRVRMSAAGRLRNDLIDHLQAKEVFRG